VKRYEFSLEIVLRARRAQESVARADLLRANLMAAQAELAQGRSRDHYDDVIASDSDPFMVHRQLSDLAAGALIGASGAVADARAQVAAAMEDYLVAARGVSVLEKLDERQRQEHAAAAQRQEANQVDELVTSRHGRNREHSPLIAQARR
jgi:flagellar biosynthesis chaperone FliJ